MTDKPSKLVPALVGGVVLAGLSIIPLINLGCCLWGIVGGAVAAYMLIRRSPVQRVTTGDGALTGTMTGLIGSLIFLVVNIPILLLSWASMVGNMREQAKKQADQNAQAMLNQIASFLEENRILGALLVWLIFALIAVGLATLGGIIGVAIFEKRKAAPPAYPPPGNPPPSYGPPPDQPPY
ncbi:MAG: hypothetical protein ACJ74J_20480 [Blastocatellia bacterium]